MTEDSRSDLPAAQEIASTELDLGSDDPEDHLATAPGGRWESAAEGDGELPTEIAGYEILDRLGAGGMGEVYLAEQVQPVRRRVALKVLRQSLAGTDANARFLAERHAMGRLDHPNVGRILEAGDDERGRPFFAMEWIAGLPIDRYCDRHQLPLADRLRLFVGVCRGVAHAHQKQLLHRDLKPSNILVTEVDGAAVPKVIDFGVAKALDQPLGGLDMRTRSLIGTPVYMSPEGLSLGSVAEPDTRSDVYSLGVVLCELLVGRRPHELGDDGLGSFLRRVAEEDPTSPSTLINSLPPEERERIALARKEGVATLRKALRGDLDWIILKAIARRRDDRYASAAELAADIERHLRSEPIEARPPSRAYYLSKFVQRHRVATVVAVTTALAICLGVAGLTVGLQRARAAEARSRADAHAARVARDEAQAVSTFLTSLFLETSPDYAQGNEPVNPSALSAVDLLERGATRAGDALGGEPKALIRVRAVLGKIYIAWGRYADARTHLDEALSLADAAALDALQRAGILVDLGIAVYYLNDYDVAESHFASAAELSRQEGPEPLAERRDRELTALEGLARVARQRGDFEACRSFLERALAIEEATPDLSVQSRWKIYSGLANLHQALDQPEIAEIYARKSYDMTRRELPETHPTRVWAVSKLAVALAMQDKLEDARPMFEETLELQTKLYGRRHPDVAVALNNLGVLLMDLDRPAEALPLHREALDIRREKLGDADTMTAWSLDNLSVAYIDLGEVETARPYQQQALDIRLAAFGPDHPLVGRSHYFLGKLDEAAGDDRGAEVHYRKSVDIRAAKLPADNTGLAEARVRLGALLVRRGDVSGEALIEQGMAVLEAEWDEDDAGLLENRELVRRSRES